MVNQEPRDFLGIEVIMELLEEKVHMDKWELQGQQAPMECEGNLVLMDSVYRECTETTASLGQLELQDCPEKMEC